MTPRLVVRLLFGFALLVPMTLGAQSFLPKDTANVPSNLSITFNPAGTQPARLKYTSKSQNLNATAESAKVTYAAAGMTVELNFGDFTSTSTTGNWQSRSNNPFKTLTITFAPSGELVSFSPSKD